MRQSIAVRSLTTAGIADMEVAKAFAYLLDTLFNLYIAALMFRLLLQIVKADYYNPLTQILVKVTDPVILPLRRILPGTGRFDLACVVAMLLLELIAVFVATQLAGIPASAGKIFAFSIFKLIRMLLVTYLVMIIANVVLSWVGQKWRHPIIPLIYQLTEPLLRKIRKIIPALGGLDLSPLIALIAIQFLLILFSGI